MQNRKDKKRSKFSQTMTKRSFHPIDRHLESSILHRILSRKKTWNIIIKINNGLMRKKNKKNLYTYISRMEGNEGLSKDFHFTKI